MDSSPFNPNPASQHSTPISNPFASSGPAQQLFRPSVNGRPSQLGAASPPARPSSACSIRSTRTAVVKVDASNELIRGDLNAVRYELETLKEERALEKLRHEQELRALSAKAEEAAKRADATESEKRFLFEKQKELSEKLQKAKDASSKSKTELERQMRRLKSENNDLKDLVGDKQEEIDTAARLQRKQVDEFETRIRTLNQTNKELKDEITARNKVLDEVQQKLEEKDAEVQGLEVEMLRVRSSTGDADTLRVLKKELSEQVAHIKSLETTNRKQMTELRELRESYKSLELVEEEKRTLESKVKMLDDVREELSSVQLQVSVLRDERNAWESYFQKEGLEFDSPESLARALVEERVERASLLEKVGRSDPELQERDRRIQELEEELRSTKEDLEKVKEASSKDAKARQRMERQRALALKEAQFLRDQLKSFQTEEVTYNQGGFDEQKNKRIEELESLLEEYKKEINELKEAAAKAGASSDMLASRKRELPDDSQNEKIGELTRRNRKLQDAVAQLQNKETLLNKEIEALHIRIQSMENTSTRILQLKDNPTARDQAVKVAELKILKEENAALLGQLEGRGDEFRMVPKATLEHCRAEIKSMERVVAEKEKRLVRLKEIFTAKAQEFREAVYSLLGWKVDIMHNGLVKVTHMFGKSDQSIEFDCDKGTMKVAGGPDSMFHKEIKNQCAFWSARGSTPCLLASILIEQYEKTTRAQLM